MSMLKTTGAKADVGGQSLILAGCSLPPLFLWLRIPIIVSLPIVSFGGLMIGQIGEKNPLVSPCTRDQGGKFNGNVARHWAWSIHRLSSNHIKADQL